MADVTDVTDVTSFFSGPPLDLKNLPMNIEDPKKKKKSVAGPQTSSATQLPTAKPTNGPLPTVASVVSGAGNPPAIQRGLDMRTPVQASPLADVTNKVLPSVTRALTPKESRQVTGNPDREKLKQKGSKAMSELASAFR